MPLKPLILFIIFTVSGNLLYSQDIHFSQFYNALKTVNPALTGFGATPIRIGLLYRNQGRTISVPYKTYTAFVDTRFSFNGLQRTWFGLGFSAYNDRAGDGLLNNTLGEVSFSVTQGFNRYNTLLVSMGYSLGLLNRTVQFNKLVFDEQWNGVKFDYNLGSNEPFTTQSVFAPNLNFGVVVSYELTNDFKWEAGGALHHINKSKTSFYNTENRIPWKWVAHGRMEYSLDDKTTLVSAFFYTLQANTQEIIFGGNLFYGASDSRMIGGLWYRWGRDVIPVVGLNYHFYKFTLSYDVNVSVLHAASNYQGGIELSLIKVFRKKVSRYPCSEFK